MPTNQELLERITASPDVFGGKPIIRDMRTFSRISHLPFDGKSAANPHCLAYLHHSL